MADEFTLDKFLEFCRPLREAMEIAFDEVTTEGDFLKATCCENPVSYFSGILGPDMAKCDVCKSEIRLILSPHVSPILLGQSITHIPSDELIAAVGERCWWIKKLDNPESVIKE